MQELHYLDFTPNRTNSPPPLVLRTTSYMPTGGGSNSGKRQFVKVNEEMFVNEIKKQPILYNTTMKDYKRFSTRHDAWAEVALSMNLSEQECKKRWRSLRDAFMKVVRNKNEEERKTWIHYRLLEFLLPYIGKKNKRSRAVEYIEGFDNDDDAEYVELEDDIEIYEGSRDPITVSYVTEDGKEVFQMLQDPDTIPEGAVIGIEETEEEDEGDEEDENYQNMHHPVQLEDRESIPTHEDQTDSFLYEERLDSTMLDIQESYEPVEQQSFSREAVKQEALSEADGSELHVEEIEMDSLISDHPEEDDINPEPEPEPEPIVETIQEQVREPTPVDDLMESKMLLPAMPVQEIPVSSSSSQSLIPMQSPPRQTSAPQTQNSQSLREEPMVISIPTPVREPENKSGCSDSDERFLLSCAPILRRLPNKKNQLARLKIQQLLFELEYDEKYSS